MFNLRFKITIIKSVFDVLWEIPRANRMIRDKDRYTEQERFDLALTIIRNMTKRARTDTLVTGQENIPKEGACIYYANHQGKYDALGILMAIGRPTSVLFGSIQANRLLARQVCGLVDAVVIDLSNPRDIVRAIKEVNDKVKGGKSILIFPEGGYVDNRNTLQEFKTGCFSCSIQTQAPIVPVAIYDSYKSMNSNSLKHVTTQVHFLKPIYAEEYKGMNKKELAALVKARIQAKMDECSQQC